MSALSVDLRSDTVTRPGDGMRRAMADAEVADDLLDGDPTTRRLEERVAGLLGKEAALFVPSGVMGNQIALALHCRPGTEVVVEEGSHVFHWEMGAASTLSGVQLRTVAAPDGVLTGELVEGAIRPESPYALRTSLVCLENPHLASGGRVPPPEAVAGVIEAARARNVPVHLDGARLWNAAVASGREPADLASGADTVMVSLSKGLGCPVGSLLAGPASAMERAWRIRRRFGGGMRQTGVLAAAGLYALDHNVERLAVDHENARLLAAELDGAPGLSTVPPETNVVMIDLRAEDADAEGVVEELADRGVGLVRFGPRRLRAVTHMEVTADEIRRAAGFVAEVVGSA